MTPSPYCVPGALASVGEVAVRGQLDERRLDPVVVAPAGTQLVVLPDGPHDHERRTHVEIQPVATAVRHPVDQLGEVDEVRNDLVDDRLALEGLAPPRRREVTPLGEGGRRLPKTLGRALLVVMLSEPPGRPPLERATHPLGRLVQRLLQPPIERLSKGARRLSVSQYIEPRVHTCLDRPLVQQVGTEAVDSADLRLFEVRNRMLDVREPRRTVGGGNQLVAGTLEPLAKPQLQLAGRLLGKGHRQHLVDARPAGRQDIDDPRDQLRGLPCPSRRLHKQRLIERGPYPLALRRIDERWLSHAASPADGLLSPRAFGSRQPPQRLQIDQFGVVLP